MTGTLSVDRDGKTEYDWKRWRKQMGRSVLKALFLVGVALAAVGTFRAWQIHRPQLWTAEAALQHVHDPQPTLATIAATVEKATLRYDQQPNEIRTARPDLAGVSPRTGTTVLGPLAAPKETWPRLSGRPVRAYIALPLAGNDEHPLVPGPSADDSRDDRLALRHRMLPQRIGGGELPMGGGRMPEAEGRRILVDLGNDLWLLSPAHLVTGPAESSTLYWPEFDWQRESSHYGLLRRLKDVSDCSQVADHCSQRELAAGWVIEEDDRPLQLTQYAGYHAYAAVAGTHGKIWAQLPLEDDSSADWHKLEGGGLTGVWLPAGTQHFVSDDPPLAEGQGAVLQVSPWVVDRFTGDQANLPFGAVHGIFGGIGLMLLSGLVLVITAPVGAKTRPPQSQTAG